MPHPLEYNILTTFIFDELIFFRFHCEWYSICKSLISMNVMCFTVEIAWTQHFISNNTWPSIFCKLLLCQTCSIKFARRSLYKDPLNAENEQGNCATRIVVLLECIFNMFIPSVNVKIMKQNMNVIIRFLHLFTFLVKVNILSL